MKYHIFYGFHIDGIRPNKNWNNIYIIKFMTWQKDIVPMKLGWTISRRIILSHTFAESVTGAFLTRLLSLFSMCASRRHLGSYISSRRRIHWQRIQQINLLNTTDFPPLFLFLATANHALNVQHTNVSYKIFHENLQGWKFYEKIYLIY